MDEFSAAWEVRRHQVCGWLPVKKWFSKLYCAPGNITKNGIFSTDPVKEAIYCAMVAIAAAVVMKSRSSW